MNASEFQLSPDCSVHTDGGTFYFNSPQEAENFLAGEMRLTKLKEELKATAVLRAKEFGIQQRLAAIDARLTEIDELFETDKILDEDEKYAFYGESHELTEERDELQAALNAETKVSALTGRYVRLTFVDPLSNWRLVVVGEPERGWVELAAVKPHEDRLFEDSVAFHGSQVEVLGPASNKLRVEAWKRSAQLGLV